MHLFTCAAVICAALVFGHASAAPADAGSGSCETEMTAFPLDPGSKCCESVPPNDILSQQPWAALVEYEHNRGGKRRMCAGTLISSKYILTAGHCVVGAVKDIATPTAVILGKHNLTKNGADCLTTEGGDEYCNGGPIRIEIEKIIPHPEYSDRAKRNDITLIRLKEAAPYTDFIRPICLPTKNPQTSPPDSPLVAVSWFKDNDNKDVKMLVTATFVNQEKCRPIYSERGHDLGSGQICAGGINHTCNGDGGSPLVYENQEKVELIGTVSFGPIPCGQKDIPSVYKVKVYTNVFEYTDWIKSNIVA